MSVQTALILVSHSATLAAGVAELAAEMAPEVTLLPAGGTSDGRIGTGFDVVEAAVTQAFDAGASFAVILTDLGSATMTADLVLETLEDERLMYAPGAFVEGAVAGAVAAQTGSDGPGVAAAVAEATRVVAADLPEVTTPQPEPSPQGEAAPSEAVTARVSVLNAQGVHARPAAQIAQLAAGFDAAITLEGQDAASVLSIMGLGLTMGAEVSIAATGVQARQAVDALVAAFADGFGEP